MAQPTAYVPAHSFTSDESVLPEFPGVQLDVELAALETFTQQVRTNLALIQRDDGALIDNVAVTFANLPTSPAEGMTRAVTDSATVTWGATITGGSTNHVLAYYNGTNWTVAAK